MDQAREKQRNEEMEKHYGERKEKRSLVYVKLNSKKQKKGIMAMKLGTYSSYTNSQSTGTHFSA